MSEHRSPADFAADAELARLNIIRSVDELKDHLSPAHIAANAQDAVRKAAAPMAEKIWAAKKNYAGAAAVAASAAAWYLRKPSSSDSQKAAANGSAPGAASNLAEAEDAALPKADPAFDINSLAGRAPPSFARRRAGKETRPGSIGKTLLLASSGAAIGALLAARAPMGERERKFLRSASDDAKNAVTAAVSSQFSSVIDQKSGAVDPLKAAVSLLTLIAGVRASRK